MQDVTIRPASLDDLPQVSALFRAVHGRERTVAHYRWKFFTPLSYWNAPRLWLLEHEQRVVASCGILPQQFWNAGQSHLAVSLSEVQVSPDSRRRGAAALLLRGLWADCAAGGARHWMVLPNQLSAPLLDSLGGEALFEVQWHRRRRISLWPRARESDADIRVRSVDAPGEWCAALWDRLRTGINGCVVPGEDWLRYRYCECPDQAYSILLASDAQGPRGMLVLGEKNFAKHCEGVIAQYLVAPGDDETLAALLDAAERHAGEKGLRALRIMVAKNAAEERRWHGLHFRPAIGGFMLYAGGLGGHMVPASLKDSENFPVHLGDHDLV